MKCSKNRFSSIIAIIILGIFLLNSLVINAQNANPTAIENYCKINLPKLWIEINKIKNKGINISYSYEKKSPGIAYGLDNITLNPKYIFNKIEQYPEDRLVIVLLHEYGHILYNRKTSRSDRDHISNEYAAFKYSVEVAIKKSRKGDSGPLDQVVKNLKLRSTNGNSDNPHTIAIKRLMKGNTWKRALEEVELGEK